MATGFLKEMQWGQEWVQYHSDAQSNVTPNHPNCTALSWSPKCFRTSRHTPRDSSASHTEAKK